MRFSLNPLFVLLSLIAPPRAQDLLYATGSFAASGPASVTARPVGWSFPKGIDSVFTFEIGTGGSIAFKLPVGVSNSAIRPGRIGLHASPGIQAGPFIDAAGHRRESRLSHGVWFTGPMNATRTVFAARSAAVTLQYRVSLSSKSAAYGDTALTVSVAAGDNGSVDLPMPPRGGAAARFSELLPQAQYEALFPNRYGFGKTGEASDGKGDFYSYASFIQAIAKLSTIRVKIVMRAGTDYAQKLIWTDTAANVTRTMITHADYNAEWNLDVKEDTVAVIRYAEFRAEGTLETRKRELAAFFAHIAHETGGGWEGAPNGGQYAWGLYWREEVAWQTDPNNKTLGYVDASNTMYPPAPGKSYHGRGPIQISWNYNYGQVSEFLYGDKNVLLRAPELVLSGGDVAFMTAIWFWMYPQAPIPSAHDIMTGKWKPDAADAAAGRDKSRFGATINVVNGVQECGHGADERATDRIGHFKFFSGIFGISVEPVLGCETQQPF